MFFSSTIFLTLCILIFFLNYIFLSLTLDLFRSLFQQKLDKKLFAYLANYKFFKWMHIFINIHHPKHWPQTRSGWWMILIKSSPETIATPIPWTEFHFHILRQKPMLFFFIPFCSDIWKWFTFCGSTDEYLIAFWFMSFGLHLRLARLLLIFNWSCGFSSASCFSLR